MVATKLRWNGRTALVVGIPAATLDSSTGPARITVDSVHSVGASSENEPSCTRGMDRSLILRSAALLDSGRHLGDLFRQVLFLLLDAFAEYVAGEAPDLHVLAGLLHNLCAQLLD